jgi:hypothetical protein
MLVVSVRVGELGGQIEIMHRYSTPYWNEFPFVVAKSFHLKHDFAVLSSPALVTMMRRAGSGGRGRYFRLDFWQGPSQDTPSVEGVQAVVFAVIPASERFA